MPTVLKTVDALTPRNMAAFALEAHAQGVALPGGSFTDLKHTLTTQLQKHINASCGPRDPLKFDITVSFDEDEIKICISAASGIPDIRLKSVIEKLNVAHPGLGWFVYDTIMDAAQKDRYPIYTPDEICSIAQYIWFDYSMSDDGFAEELRAINGWGDDYTIETIKDEHEGYWPSDLLKSFCGHEWMLGASIDTKNGRKQIGKKPKALSLTAATKASSARHIPEELRRVVASALDLRFEMDRKDSTLSRAKGLTEKDIADYYDDIDFDCLMTYGAACFVGWDDLYMMHEVIQHHEELEMQGDSCTDIFYIFRADASKPDEVSALINAFQDFLRRHAAISKLLQHFHVEK